MEPAQLNSLGARPALAALLPGSFLLQLKTHGEPNCAIGLTIRRASAGAQTVTPPPQTAMRPMAEREKQTGQ